MEKESNTKQYETLKRDINGLLRDFERNREWADFSNWLHRLNEHLLNHHFAKLPQQITLCKRLAQCLNPSLPAGVHSTALKVYEIILKNFSNKVELLPLLALGLFPFFEHSNSQNKIGLLKIFEEYFASETDCIQMVVGLANAILTGLNENSEDLAKRIYNICDNISRHYGRIWVDGAVWINILKSPKVRLAGFKYFMKVFKDRDRLQTSEEGKPEDEQKIIEELQTKIEGSRLNEEEKVLLISIHGYRNRPDDHNTRFPNFSTLVVNTLCVCLDCSAENMIKRSALDLLINYLKLSGGNFGEREGIMLVEMMLLLLQSKEYNLTNRVYKYLFDQPNAEGVFYIDPLKKDYELTVLRKALQNLLTVRVNEPILKEEGVKEQGILLIIQILISDHPMLANYLLNNLSFQIVLFIHEYHLRHTKRDKGLARSTVDFYVNVISKHKRIFLQSIVSQIEALKEGQEEIDLQTLVSTKTDFNTILEVLQFYFCKLEKIPIFNKSNKRKGSQANVQIPKKEESNNEEFLQIRGLVLRELIHHLFLGGCQHEKTAIATLDLCNQIYREYTTLNQDNKQEVITLKEIHFVEHLLERQAQSSRKGIYAQLITLHPHPKKQMLLPYIEESSLTIVCISLLLGSESPAENERSPRKSSLKSSSNKQSFALSESISLSKQEQQQVFFAIFKLLNCHLFEARSLEFIQRFRYLYNDTFNSLIDVVQPSQWLIYWRKVQGNVWGGIVRMIENIDSRNSYHQHLSNKWISDSESIISKIIDSIYHLMDMDRKTSEEEDEGRQSAITNWNTKDYQHIYTLIQLVFRATSTNFSKFFFLQKDKYLHPFIIFIFKCLESDSFEVKSKSIEMLTYLLSKALELQQKQDMVTLTLPNVLAILQRTIELKKTLQPQKEGQAKHQLLTMSNLEIELLEYVSKMTTNMNQLVKKAHPCQEELIKTLRLSCIYDIVLKGMMSTKTPYIKTLYIDSSKELVQMVANLDKSLVEVTAFMNKILDRLFVMLKNTDMNTIEDIIRSRNESNLGASMLRRHPNRSISEQEREGPPTQQSVQEEDVRQNLNLQEKYGEIIEMWNSIKFYIQFAIKIELKEMPVINLLSLILQSFPFSYLKYTPAGEQTHQNNLEALEDEINNVTGLKKEVLDIFEILWNKESRQILDFLIEKGDPRILIHSSLDPSKVLSTFNSNSKLKEVLRYLRGRFSLPRNTLHYHIDTLIAENQLLYFLYVYLLYCNMRLLNSRRIATFCESLVNLLQSLKATPHVQSKLWLLEILDVIGQRMMNTKELNIENWARIKLDLQNIAKQILDEVVAVITKSKLFTHRTQIKTGLFTIFSKEEREVSLFDFVKIFPPTICAHYDRYKDSARKLNECNTQLGRLEEDRARTNLEQPRERLSSYILAQDNTVRQKENKIDQFLFSQFLNRSEEDYIDYLSLCGLRTLIRIGNSLLLNLHDKDVGKVCLLIKEILMNLLPICENREPENQHFNELIAEYLHAVLDHEMLRAEIIRLMRRNILQIYMANDFFKCTQKTLPHWRAVIDYCTEGYDLLAQLLSREGLFEGIFTKKAQATRLKIKSFQRVCFVIYAGRVDKYENKLRTVLESLNEVMKQDNPAPALLILILFCIRILLMRLSAISLNKLFRSVWPSLITLLIQIFRRDHAVKNVNLQLAGIKVIELVHALQLEQFMLHKWMFVFDYFGLKIEPMGDLQDNMIHSQIFTPFLFKPFLTTVLPNNRFRCKFMPEKASPRLSHSVLRRRLIVKKPSVETEQELNQYALLLMQYMMDLNESRAQIDKKEVESLIEDDFISLDYIFKIK